MQDRESLLLQQIEHLMTMLEIVRVLNSTLYLAQLEEIIVESAAKITGCEDSSILLLDPQTGELRFEASAGLQAETTEPIVVPLDSSIAGWIVRHNESVIIADVSRDPRYFHQADQATGFQTRSLLGVPITFKGRMIGALMAVNKLEGEFTSEDAGRLTVLAAQAAVAIENARLLAELHNAYEELNQLDRLKSEFIATTSHELRTPLTAIKGYLQLISQGMVAPPRQPEILQTITRHVDTVIHLVNDLMLVQEMEALELHMGRVDIAAIARSEMGAMRQLAESANIRWVDDIPEDLLAVRGDAEHLRRMLHNLLDNAIKFSPDGGDITVRGSAGNGMVCLQVSDPGVGIPPEEQEKIFERFYRIERPGDRLFGGLGLGLSIARHIIEQHGGHIRVTSAVGQGSTFTVELPAWVP
jgi:signal transduction histidine kinase